MFRAEHLVGVSVLFDLNISLLTPWNETPSISASVFWISLNQEIFLNILFLKVNIQKQIFKIFLA